MPNLIWDSWIVLTLSRFPKASQTRDEINKNNNLQLTVIVSVPSDNNRRVELLEGEQHCGSIDLTYSTPLNFFERYCTFFFSSVYCFLFFFTYMEKRKRVFFPFDFQLRYCLSIVTVNKCVCECVFI